MGSGNHTLLCLRTDRLGNCRRKGGACLGEAERDFWCLQTVGREEGSTNAFNEVRGHTMLKQQDSGSSTVETSMVGENKLEAGSFNTTDNKGRSYSDFKASGNSFPGL